MFLLCLIHLDLVNGLLPLTLTRLHLLNQYNFVLIEIVITHRLQSIRGIVGQRGTTAFPQTKILRWDRATGEWDRLHKWINFSLDWRRYRNSFLFLKANLRGLLSSSYAKSRHILVMLCARVRFWVTCSATVAHRIIEHNLALLKSFNRFNSCAEFRNW